MIKKTLNISNPEAKLKMTDDQILQDLRTLSNGELALPSDTVLTKLDFKTPPPGNRVKTSGSSNNNQQQNKSQNNYNNKRNNNNNNNNKRPSNNNNNNRQKKSYK
ncbi:Uncharacterised protein [Mycobacterium tuberculosis]|nr:Uncharacterised protein [Mycobacterium tuberculosis]